MFFTLLATFILSKTFLVSLNLLEAKFSDKFFLITVGICAIALTFSCLFISLFYSAFTAIIIILVDNEFDFKYFYFANFLLLTAVLLVNSVFWYITSTVLNSRIMCFAPIFYFPFLLVYYKKIIEVSQVNKLAAKIICFLFVDISCIFSFYNFVR
ncbi:MAG: hypothetical protein LBF33_02555 [Oscillospiraceae bacterium]|jgi:hypothetical protein|nr:hypothetical protein [Oscillospiraceae bacterium]